MGAGQRRFENRKTNKNKMKRGKGADLIVKATKDNQDIQTKNDYVTIIETLLDSNF